MQTGEQAGDDMQKEAFRTPEAVASIGKSSKIIDKKYQKRTMVDLATGQAMAMRLTFSRVPKLATNNIIKES